MNYKILKLLFDPRETISKQEFLLGIIILFLLAFSTISDLIINTSVTSIISSKGVHLLATHQVVKPFIIPSLPIGFILFYSAVTLAIKRVKDLHNKLWIGILAGIFIFLFFDVIFFKTTTNMSLFSELVGIEIDDNVKKLQTLSLAFFFILGIGSISYLSTLKGAKPYIKDISKKGSLTINQFITQLGILLIAVFIFSILFTISFGIYNSNSLGFRNHNILWQLVLLGFVCLFIIIWYLKLVYMRLKNTTLPFLYYFLSFILYTLGVLAVLTTASNTDNLNYINFSLSIFSIINMIFSLATLSLFLLDKDSKPLAFGTEKHD